FRGVQSRFPLLLPILKEHDVATRVVQAIANNRRRVVMPWLCHLVPMIRVLPVGLFDAIANFLGVNSSMKAFVGRSAPPHAAEPPAQRESA
ncbi:MAG: short-chain dehydrogenase, partial [Deltaproteobacteria bacterium]|nr:short-chain dehydrogenase [Deltaproteobacteria bacterium]